MAAGGEREGSPKGSGGEREDPTRMSDETNWRSWCWENHKGDCYVGTYFPKGRGVSGIQMSIVKRNCCYVVIFNFHVSS